MKLIRAQIRRLAQHERAAIRSGEERLQRFAAQEEIDRRLGRVRRANQSFGPPVNSSTITAAATTMCASPNGNAARQIRKVTAEETTSVMRAQLCPRKARKASTMPFTGEPVASITAAAVSAGFVQSGFFTAARAAST